MKNPFFGFQAILYKEFITVLRDRMTLFFMFFPPILQIIAFGFAIETDVRNVSLGVYDECQTQQSRLLIQHFVNTQNFKVTRVAHSLEELTTQLRRGDIYVGLHLPPDFARDFAAGRSAQVQVLIDGSNNTVAGGALNTTVGVALNESLHRAQEAGEVPVMALDVRPRVLYNPDMRSPNFFVPGVIGMALQIATVFATAMSLVRERERGTLEQLLVSPLSKWGLMLGKIIPFLCIVMAMSALLVTIMRWVFFVPIQGSLVTLFIMLLVYQFTLLSLGLLVATRAENQMQALQMAMVFLLPSVFFSGFIFLREAMPWIFYAISTVLPASYFISMVRAIVLRGAVFMDFWQDALILTAIGIGVFSLAVARFQKRLG